jgi:gliding motility-associated-like protein
MIKTAYINIIRPTASFTLSDTLAVCPPLTVNFASTSTNAVAQVWDFGNGGSSVLTSPSSTYSAPGVYTVRLIVANSAGCPDTATANVRVLGYSGALSYTDLSGCAPLTVPFTATVTNVPSIIWDFSDGTTMPATGATISHTYMTPGTYVPKLIFSDGGGCTSSSDGLDTIRVDDVIAGFKAAPPCEKTNLLLTDTSRSFFSAITNSHWDFGGSGIATGNPVTRAYPAAGTYPVTLISTNNNGCKDTITKNVTIFPLPVIVAPPDTAVCIPDGIVLTASGARSYVWSPGTALSCTACASPVASPAAPILYVVTGTDSNGCAGKDSVRIAIQTKTTFVTNGSGEICLGKSYQLVAGGATVYSWKPAESLDNAAIANPVASPKVNTTYIVTGREGSCQEDTHMVKVVVRPLPVVDAGGGLQVVAGNGVLLQASGTGITRVAWDADPSLSCLGCYAPEARPKVSTTYRITAYNEYGCTATDSVRVMVLCDGSQLFIPNTFTPNADGVNDYFFPRGQGIDRITSFRVYSRWGELLFERGNMEVNSEYQGWNGTYNGRKLNPDVYVYVIEATCDTGEPIVFKGDISLLR